MSTKVKKLLASTHLDISKLPEELVPKSYVPQNKHTYNRPLWLKLEHVLLNPYFSPLIAENLHNLPKTYVFTGEKDPLRDEGMWYVQRLRAAGNGVKHIHWKTGFHGIFFFHDVIEEVSELLNEMFEHAKNNL